MATEKDNSKTVKRTAKTVDQIRAEIEAARQRLANAEAKEFGFAIEAALKKQNVVSSINVIKANVKGANDLLILRQLGELMGIKRLVITQSDPKPRKKKTA